MISITIDVPPLEGRAKSRLEEEKAFFKFSFGKQGDQMGQIFACCAIFYLGKFF
jgi:hypothetical protein